MPDDLNAFWKDLVLVGTPSAPIEIDVGTRWIHEIDDDVWGRPDETLNIGAPTVKAEPPGTVFETLIIEDHILCCRHGKLAHRVILNYERLPEQVGLFA